jgi:hypothetical protein
LHRREVRRQVTPAGATCHRRRGLLLRLARLTAIRRRAILLGYCGVLAAAEQITGGIV